MLIDILKAFAMGTGTIFVLFVVVPIWLFVVVKTCVYAYYCGVKASEPKNGPGSDDGRENDREKFSLN